MKIKETKETVVVGGKHEITVNFIEATLENGSVYTEAIDENDDEGFSYFMEKHHEEEVEHFLNTEKTFIDATLAKEKERFLKEAEERFNIRVNLENIIQMMYDNAGEDYVGNAGDYEEGVKSAFAQYADYATDEIF